MQTLEREVNEGRKRCAELEDELDQVNKDIGDARSDRNESSRAQRRAELIENLKQFPGVVSSKRSVFVHRVVFSTAD